MKINNIFKIISILITIIMLQGCVVKRYVSPETQITIIDMETLKPISDSLIIENTSNKEGCLTVQEVGEYHFILFPFVGTYVIHNFYNVQTNGYKDYTVYFDSLSHQETIMHFTFI